MESKATEYYEPGKKYLSRKLIAFLINDLILVGFSFAVLLINSSLLVPSVLISFMVLIVLNGVTYMGGKALEVWSKSKYFHSELIGK